MSAKMTNEETSPSDTTKSSSVSRCQQQQQQQQQQDNDEYELLSQLRLPRMSSSDESPSLRILVVSHVDLPSAAALAEHALMPDNRQDLGGGKIDCIIACGPFSNDELLQTRYLQGRNRRRRNNNNNNNNTLIHEQPFRSREMTAALEGALAATIAQLEGIACRVVYCPHPTDPCTILSKNEETSNHLRLTPNSHNIHSAWLSLAPGIGCCGYCGISQDQRQDLQGSIEQVRVQHGYEYEDTLWAILQDAPSSSLTSTKQDCKTSSTKPTISFALDKMQAILVTQVGEDKLSPKSSCSSAAAADKDAFEWPKHHLHFLDSPRAQSYILLNIASAPPSCPPFSQLRGKTYLVAPGSLAKHGDYCLVDISVVRNDEDKTTNKDKGGSVDSKTYRWKVDAVHHRNMNG